jgi:LssY C-terminus
MRVPPGACRRLAPLLVMFCSTLALACEGVPAGQTLWIRLSSPVSSYSSKVGDTVHAVLIEAVTCGSGVAFPLGTRIDGKVVSVRKVGWGIRHETSALQIQFDRAIPSEGSPVAMSAAVVEVENAREQVSKGVIQGVLSSDSPQGRINSRLRHLPTWNPYSDVGLIVFKASFPIFPEPEIYFPEGTDLRIKLTEPILALVTASEPPMESAVEQTENFQFDNLVQSLPQRSTTVKLADADVVNLVFVGSRQEVESAFEQAGWSTSDVFNERSFFRNFYAFLNNSGYAQAPMRPFLLDGKPADMNWQKSLNSYARRDHLRIWEWPGSTDAETVWVSSSTHDTGATLSLEHHRFVHHITSDIDEERSKVIRDLNVAGCVKAVHLVPRPKLATISQNATGDLVSTDGALAVVELKECQPMVPGLTSGTATTRFRPGNHIFRYFRRQILTFRSDIWRANIIYGVYDLTRMSIVAWKHHSALTANREANSYSLRAQ